MKQCDGYTIRLATADDEVFLWEMLYQAIYIPAGKAKPNRSILQEPAFAHYVDGWGHYRDDEGLIAVDQHKQAIGAVWMRLFGADDPGWGFVDADTPELSIAVLPAHRGQGLGTALLRGLIERVRKDYAALSLSVDPDNRAMKLYERLGFEVVGASGSSVTMRKKLS